MNGACLLRLRPAIRFAFMESASLGCLGPSVLTTSSLRCKLPHETPERERVFLELQPHTEGRRRTEDCLMDGIPF